MNMLHRHGHAAWTCTRGLDRDINMGKHMLLDHAPSMLHVHVHAACPSSCFVSMSMLHAPFHVACPCPCRISMSMLHVHIPAAQTKACSRTGAYSLDMDTLQEHGHEHGHGHGHRHGHTRHLHGQLLVIYLFRCSEEHILCNWDSTWV
jgi:hypothetical protein